MHHYLRFLMILLGLAAVPAAAADTPAPTAVATVPASRPGGVAALVPPGTGGLEVSVSGGFDYSSGRYGGPSRTEALVIPAALRVANGPLRAWAVLPYVRIEGPGLVLSGSDGAAVVVDADAPVPRRVRDGFGDLSVGAAYLLPPERLGGVEVDLSARVKLPTARDRDQISTGKTDVTLAVDVTKPVGRVAPFVTLAYIFVGEPAGFDLRDSIGVSVGTSVELGRAVAILSYEYARSVSRQAANSHELFAALTGRIAPKLRGAVYGVAGLSRGAPSAGAGLLVTVDF